MHSSELMHCSCSLNFISLRESLALHPVPHMDKVLFASSGISAGSVRSVNPHYWSSKIALLGAVQHRGCSPFCNLTAVHQSKWTWRIKTLKLKFRPFLWSPGGGSPPSVPLSFINCAELNCKTNNCVLRGRCRPLNLISWFSSYATLAM